MNKRGLTAIVALSAAILLYVYTTGAAAPAAPSLLPAGAAHPPLVVETARVQAHLAEVERELLARDVSHLSESQRTARARHIRELRAYREAGVFPHNHDFPGERVPYFVDEHGTLCAMAHLISRSGHHELVERVRLARNNARVHELADDPELAAWLEDAGLSLDEAAAIQPMYDGCCVIGPEQEDGVTAEHAVAAVLTGAIGGASIGMSVLPGGGADRPRWPGVIGIAAGVAGIGLGLDRFGDGGPHGTLAAVNVGIGAASLAVGAWRLLGSSEPQAVVTESAPAAAAGPELTASPLFSTDAGPGLGVLLRLAF